MLYGSKPLEDRLPSSHGEPHELSFAENHGKDGAASRAPSSSCSASLRSTTLWPPSLHERALAAALEIFVQGPAKD